ncbi:uncharacterized protein LOC143426161 [Xylocopa sonorina]|uniref:uncharacterized protein LOC143426161 n=1 Tax=Xylocopa sonorina TaxID=1818115 RepID=UPI00403ACB45
MSRSNFRIKLDLCKFYSDVRRFCWIFIDGTKTLKVAHMKHHITGLFNIKEPFHLLLNETEYLPPNEDIRILKENETILVSPGSGLKNELDSPVNIVTLEEDRVRQEAENSSIKSERTRNSVHHKQLQTNLPLMLSSPIQEIISSDTPTNNFRHESSEISTMSCEIEDSEISSIVESKVVDTSIIEEHNIKENIMAYPKRKRVRHKKKKKAQAEQLVANEEENKLKKPKIINSCIVSGKHIRFDNLSSGEITEDQITHSEVANGIDTTEQPSQKLANLLSLGKSTVPHTFTNTRIKEEVKVENMSDEETHFNASSEKALKRITTITVSKERKALNKLIEDFEVMTEKPQLKDTIAFKMLKIGADYTPQVSDFIVGEVISFCSDTSVYTLKISHGISEVQVPVGKFTVTEEEEEVVLDDTITINYAQIMEPRLISTCVLDRMINSINCI